MDAAESQDVLMLVAVGWVQIMQDTQAVKLLLLLAVVGLLLGASSAANQDPWQVRKDYRDAALQPAGHKTPAAAAGPASKLLSDSTRLYTKFRECQHLVACSLVQSYVILFAQVLGVRRSATKGEITRAFRRYVLCFEL